MHPAINKMQAINNHLEKLNIRKAESLWLAFVHLVALVGLIHVTLYCSNIVKVKSKIT